jgi:thiosulfate dehydrogenase [quinone] large subunit
MSTFVKSAKWGWLWLVVRCYLGYQWVEAGYHKLTGAKPFDAAGFLKGAIAKSIPATAGATPVVQPWWASFLQDFALPNVKLFNSLIMMGEILVGIALIVGFATLFAATMGMLMNISFILSGSTSTNPNLLAIAIVLVAVGGAYAGYVGVDYWFRPWFRNQVARLSHGETNRRSPTVMKPVAH